MTYTATITSKGQMTIPHQIVKKLKLKKSQKLVFHLENNRIYLETSKDMIKRLAGSFPMPDKFKGVSIDKLIHVSKQKHFKNKKQ